MKRVTIKSTVLKSLTDDQKEKLLSHFNSIYECEQLTDNEYNITYLAWLWANGFVYKKDNGMNTFEESETGVPLTDYEITIEDDVKGGVNLDLTYSHYGMDKIIDLIKRNK